MVQSQKPLSRNIRSLGPADAICSLVSFSGFDPIRNRSDPSSPLRQRYPDQSERGNLRRAVAIRIAVRPFDLDQVGPIDPIAPPGNWRTLIQSKTIHLARTGFRRAANGIGI
jgi:hypothetical protein